jgi:hypothetical protein
MTAPHSTVRVSLGPKGTGYGLSGELELPDPDGKPGRTTHVSVGSAANLTEAEAIDQARHWVAQSATPVDVTVQTANIADGDPVVAALRGTEAAPAKGRKASA